METIIFGRWWRSHQSIACKGLCIFRFCVMSWKGESEPTIKFCMGRKIELVQKFTTIQNFGHNECRASGTRVEYFHRIHHIAAHQQSPRVHEQNERPSSIPRTNYLHVDVSMTSYVDLKTMNRKVLLTPHLCLYLQKDFQQDVVPRTWIRKGVVSYLHWQTTRRMGQSRWIDDDQIQRKRTPSFPSNESILSRNSEKQRRWKIINTLLCRWGYDQNCFSHNNFCESAQYLRSSRRNVWRL